MSIVAYVPRYNRIKKRSSFYKPRSRFASRRASIYSGRALTSRHNAMVSLMRNPQSVASHNIVAPRYQTKLQYGYSGYIDVAATEASWAIKGNSCNLPGYTTYAFTGIGTLVPATSGLSGLQPAGLTALSGLYKKYRITGSTIRLTCIPTGVGVPIQLVVIPRNQETSLADTQLGMVLPYSKAILTNNAANTHENTIYRKFSTATLYGMTDYQVSSDNVFWADIGSDPTEVWYWHCMVQSTAGSNLSGLKPVIQVHVTYDVEFFDQVENVINT